jgi:tetratricopeptide (TPR) repeat protein
MESQSVLAIKLIEEAVKSYQFFSRKLVEKAIADQSENDENSEQILSALKEHRNTIKRLFGVKDNILLQLDNPETVKAIKKIRDDQDFYARLISEIPAIEKEDVIDYYGEHWLIKLNAEYDLENFFVRRIEAGAIILHRRPSQKILKLFGKLRDCYTCGLYEATMLFCRAILEQSLKNNKKASEQFDRFMRSNPKEKDNLENRIENSPLPKQLKEKAQDIRKYVNSIIHNANIEEYPSEKIYINLNQKETFGVTIHKNEPLMAIRDTVFILEELCK